ncbi:hypothetical protein SDC9_183731 [bioreactor metagenome]|uniref:Uncharacterized protein n=1 Tax=bioreactor metagenome TaxID=1076179 RepID=A0A645HKT3_9ZZZZ
MVTSKPALHKIKKTTYKDINLGTIPSLVGFTGLFSSYTMDPKEYDVVKGSLRPKNQAKDAYILSSLTQSDVSAATCKENGQKYEITLTIKGGAISQTSNGSIGKYQNDFENISETIASSAKDGITADSFTGNVNSASAYIIADKTTKQITAMKFSSEVTYIAKNPRVDGTLYTTQVKYTAVTTSEFSNIVY